MGLLLGVGLLLGGFPWLEPRAGGAAEVALQSHHGPAVLPRHGHQADGAAYAVEVLHKECPPRAVIELHDATLVGIGAGGGVLVDGAELELRAVLADAVLRATRHLRQRGGVVAVGLVGGDDARLVRPPDALRARAECAAVGRVVGRDEVVHAVNLVHVMAFAHTVTFRNDDALSALDGSAHVGLQFGTLHRAVAVNGVHLAVVVEQHAEVVDVALHVMVRPRTADVLRCVALQPLAIDVAEHVELAVGVTDARCPDALTVNFLMVLQREAVLGEVEAVEAVGDVFPVHQVLRVEDDQSRHRVHRRAGEVVVVAHAEDVRVGELVVEQGIGKRAVTVVSRPRFRLCLCAHDAEGHEGSSK